MYLDGGIEAARAVPAGASSRTRSSTCARPTSCATTNRRCRSRCRRPGGPLPEYRCCRRPGPTTTSGSGSASAWPGMLVAEAARADEEGSRAGGGESGAQSISMMPQPLRPALGGARPPAPARRHGADGGSRPSAYCWTSSATVPSSVGGAGRQCRRTQSRSTGSAIAVPLLADRDQVHVLEPRQVVLRRARACAGGAWRSR